MGRLVMGFLLAAGLGYALVVAGMYLAQRRFQYHPGPPAGSPSAAGLDDGVAEVRFGTEDGETLAGWFAPPGRAGAPTVVYFHGNAGNLDWLADKARHFRKAGLGILFFDWRGFGASSGRPTEQGLYADGRAALAFLAGQGIARADQVFYGESLGTGVATLMAAEAAGAGAPPRAVVLEAPFTSAVAVGAKVYPWLPVGWLMHDRYPSLGRIDRLGAPLLILHGEADSLIPVSHGRTLLAAAAEPKAGWFAPAGEHADLWDHGAGEAVLDWLRGLER
ncbi:alpha/beta hydrolase [Roseospirillum parvum]|uniref:Serine aminopeptidase S33 domain-containing protein n=1 Tax=Roseospirillum parvum TaxID=83401 RepID=A0A1G7V611_9PROT|nr:alpha/beta hydrolase [Roseospirillum parvum]SDG54941.1 hypothetical protein SAMN05421742_101545 [Roseospirillum parvum]